MLAHYSAQNPLPVSLLIITNEMNIHAEKLFSLVIPEVVVIDGSVTNRQAQFMAALLNSKGWKVHVVHTDGAFVVRC